MPVLKESNHRHQSPAPVRAMTEHVYISYRATALLWPFNGGTENFFVCSVPTQKFVNTCLGTAGTFGTPELMSTLISRLDATVREQLHDGSPIKM